MGGKFFFERKRNIQRPIHEFSVPNKMSKFLGWWLITLHSTITWLTLTRSLDGSEGKSKTLTLYSDPYPYTNQNHYPNHNPNPNEKLYLLPYMVMSPDITWPKQFFARNLSGKHFNPTSCGVIWKQRSKIRRCDFNCRYPFRKISKFECRVI